MESGSVIELIDKIGNNTVIDPSVEVVLFNRPETISRGMVIGNDCTIYSRNRFVFGDMQANAESDMVIGDHVMINSGGYLSAEGGLVIEDYVLIGPNCNILSAGHNYSDPDLYIQQQGLSYGKITIKKNAWIGASCVILQGITIGEGAIVGAGSVVTSDIPPMAIAVGNPSKVIKYRPGKYPCYDTENSASQERTAGQQTISKEKVENQTGTNHEKIRLEKEIIQIHQGYQEEIKRLNTEIKEIHQSYQKKIDLLHAEMEEVHKGYGLKLMEQKKKQFPIRFSLRG